MHNRSAQLFMNAHLPLPPPPPPFTPLTPYSFRVQCLTYLTSLGSILNIITCINVKILQVACGWYCAPRVWWLANWGGGGRGGGGGGQGAGVSYKFVLHSQPLAVGLPPLPQRVLLTTNQVDLCTKAGRQSWLARVCRDKPHRAPSKLTPPHPYPPPLPPTPTPHNYAHLTAPE